MEASKRKKARFRRNLKPPSTLGTNRTFNQVKEVLDSKTANDDMSHHIMLPFKSNISHLSNPPYMSSCSLFVYSFPPLLFPSPFVFLLLLFSRAEENTILVIWKNKVSILPIIKKSWKTTPKQNHCPKVQPNEVQLVSEVAVPNNESFTKVVFIRP